MNDWLSIQAITKMLYAGGWMMPALVFVGAWIGYLLVLRTLELRLVSVSLEKPLASNVAQASVLQPSQKWRAMQQKMILQRTPVLRQTLIASAPLIGLLGTVAGMITTFSSLSDGAWVQPSGGIAGGISQALLTTQLGLGIALPSLFWQRLLQRWARRLLLRWESLAHSGGNG